MRDDEHNPFAAPEDREVRAPDPATRSSKPLASRWARLGAAILDVIILVAALFVLGIVVGLLLIAGSSGDNPLLDPDHQLMINLVSNVVGLALFLLINGFLLAKRGQTVGKLVAGIRIVDHRDDRIPPFGRAYGIRYLLIQVISLVPLVGGLFGLVDILFIFRSDKRCIHDLMAGTKVVVA